MARFFAVSRPSTAKSMLTIPSRTPASRFSGFRQNLKTLQNAEDNTKLQEAQLAFAQTGDFATYQKFLEDFIANKKASTDSDDQLWGARLDNQLQDLKTQQLQLSFNTAVDNYDAGQSSLDSLVGSAQDILSKMPAGADAERMRAQVNSLINRQASETRGADAKRIQRMIEEGADPLDAAKKFEDMAAAETDPSTKETYLNDARNARIKYVNVLYSNLENNYRDTNMSIQDFMKQATGIQQIATDNKLVDVADQINVAVDNLRNDLASGDSFTFLGKKLGGTGGGVDLSKQQVQVNFSDGTKTNVTIGRLAELFKSGVKLNNQIPITPEYLVGALSTQIQALPNGSKLKTTGIPPDILGGLDNKEDALLYLQDTSEKIAAGTTFAQYSPDTRTWGLNDSAFKSLGPAGSVTPIQAPNGQVIDPSMAPTNATGVRLTRHVVNGQEVYIPEYQMPGGTTELQVTPDIAKAIGLQTTANLDVPVGGFDPGLGKNMNPAQSLHDYITKNTTPDFSAVAPGATEGANPLIQMGNQIKNATTGIGSFFANRPQGVMGQQFPGTPFGTTQGPFTPEQVGNVAKNVVQGAENFFGPPIKGLVNTYGQVNQAINQVPQNIWGGLQNLGGTLKNDVAGWFPTAYATDKNFGTGQTQPQVKGGGTNIPGIGFMASQARNIQQRAIDAANTLMSEAKRIYGSNLPDVSGGYGTGATGLVGGFTPEAFSNFIANLSQGIKIAQQREEAVRQAQQNQQSQQQSYVGWSPAAAKADYESKNGSGAWQRDFGGQSPSSTSGVTPLGGGGPIAAIGQTLGMKDYGVSESVSNFIHNPSLETAGAIGQSLKTASGLGPLLKTGVPPLGSAAYVAMEPLGWAQEQLAKIPLIGGLFK